jgi:hypothetical protein
MKKFSKKNQKSRKNCKMTEKFLKNVRKLNNAKKAEKKLK